MVTPSCDSVHCLQSNHIAAHVCLPYWQNGKCQTPFCAAEEQERPGAAAGKRPPAELQAAVAAALAPRDAALERLAALAPRPPPYMADAIAGARERAAVGSGSPTSNGASAADAPEGIEALPSVRQLRCLAALLSAGAGLTAAQAAAARAANGSHGVRAPLAQPQHE